MRKYIFILAVVFVCPVAVHASVLINEVAWMGTTVSANAEWIELFNTDSSTVNLSGWQVNSSSGSPTISLTGSISGNGYYLLERTSDETVPGVAADQIYTGTLTNSGATLTLLNSSGAAEDTVIGGSNWANIGGDNASKQTAQRTASGWTTAPGTPRAVNPGGSTSVTTDDSSTSVATSTATSTAAATTSGSSTWTPTPSALTVTAGPDQAALLDVPLHLGALVTTKGGSVDTNAVIAWSFGDGSTGSGSQMDKTYRYPGTYIVEVSANDGATIGRDEIIVNVAAGQVSIFDVSNDGVTVENKGAERLDLSGWQLSAGGGAFRFPPGTIIMPESNVLFPFSITNLTPSRSATLVYPDGVVASRYAPSETAIVALAATSSPQVPSAAQTPPSAPGSSLVQGTTTKSPVQGTKVIASEDAEEALNAPATTSSLLLFGSPAAAAEAAAAPASKSFFHSPWLLGFLGLLAASGGAFVLL